MPDTSVKFFRSTDAGAPSVSSAAGSLISLLDACLINGYGTVTVNPLVVSGGVATGTVSVGHGFTMLGSTGPVVTVAGVTGALSGLNGTWRIASVPSSTTFTFACASIPDGTATGTITAKRAPAGWTKPYAGTNKAAYQAAALGGTGCLLRMDNTAGAYGYGRGYATMSDVDTGTDPFPTSGQCSDANRPSWEHPVTSWLLAADDYAMVLSSHNTSWYTLGVWGDFKPANPADGYHCLLLGHHPGISPYYSMLLGSTPSLNRWIVRAADGVTKSAQASLLGAQTPGNSSWPGYGSFCPYPAPGVGGVVLAPIAIFDGMIRGYLPGTYQPLHNLPGDNGDVVGCIIEETSRDLVLRQLTQYGITNGGRVAIDCTGPWR